jgi:arylsulfatase A
MPGKITPGVTSQMASVIDLYPTALALAGAAAPKETAFDGLDLSPVLFQGKSLPERPFFYYRGPEIFACRLGEWKAHFKTQIGYGEAKAETPAQPLLFHLGLDPSEKRDVAADHADVISRIQAAVETHRATVTPVPSQLE